MFDPFRRLARWRRRHPALPLVGDIRTPAAREAALLRATVKALGAELARQRSEAGFAGPGAPVPAGPVALDGGLGGRVCRQADIEADWLRFWCGRLGIAPAYHRKVWEACFVAQAAWGAGALAPGRRVLGFAVGREPLPSLFAAHGAEVVATDLPARDRRARGWLRTGQHGGGGAASRAALFRPDLLDAEAFDRLVAFRAVDMRRIPPDLLDGGFDLVWSACAMEHLGGLERGARFVLDAMRCLRPGGLAVHTTELNLDEAGGTLRRGETVLFQRRHLDALARRLAEAGHEMLPLDDRPGEGALDGFVDMPPYDGAEAARTGFPPPHLRLSIGGFPVTSVGIVARAGEKQR